MEKRFLSTHEWVFLNQNIATVGISEHAQNLLGEIVYIELPLLNNLFKKNTEVAVIESVKAASDIYMPMSGEIIDVNNEISQNTEIINQDPYDKGWIFKIQVSDIEEYQQLLTEEDYKKIIQGI